MKLITTDEQLRSHLPNIIASVKVETPLIERLMLFLDHSEDWVINTFTSESTFNTICGYTDSNNIKILCSRLVVADALRRAIPSLDIVLTPNGFGVISTNNLTPASKPRIDRLVGSMLSHRDDCIAALLPELPGARRSSSDASLAKNWLNSVQADFFGATLFPTLALVEQVSGNATTKWDRYLELRSQVINLEASLAEEWLSPELLSALRSKNLCKTLSQREKFVVAGTTAQIITYLKGGSFSTRRLADIVNYIRQNPDDFPAWHNSATAELFSPPVFRNKKNSPAYFF